MNKKMDLGSSLTSNNVYEESIKKIFNMCRLEYHKTSFTLIWLYSAEHSQFLIPSAWWNCWTEIFKSLEKVKNNKKNPQ